MTDDGEALDWVSYRGCCPYPSRADVEAAMFWTAVEAAGTEPGQ